jgi:hypothetical protein
MLHMAASHTRAISEPLADAIIAQFPERFGATAMASPDMTTTIMPTLPGRDRMNGSNDMLPGDQQSDDQP